MQKISSSLEQSYNIALSRFVHAYVSACRRVSSRLVRVCGTNDSVCQRDQSYCELGGQKGLTLRDTFSHFHVFTLRKLDERSATRDTDFTFHVFTFSRLENWVTFSVFCFFSGGDLRTINDECF